MKSREVFNDVLNEVFEQFAFMFVDDDDASDDFKQYKGDFLHANITFSGSGKGGVIALSAPENLCKELAQNILGDEDVSEAMAEDALKELSNIVCGKLTERLFGNKNVFELTVPSVYRIYKDKWSEMAADRDTSLLYVEGKPFLASIMIDGNEE